MDPQFSKRLKYTLLAYLCLALGSFPTDGETIEDPTEISVLTYNVLADPWKVEKRIPALLALLRDSDADIIALQEVAPWFARKLEAEPWLDRYHYPQSEGRIQVAHEFLILSKFPVSNRQILDLPSKQSRIALFTTVKIGEKDLTFVTCHLDSFLEDGPIRARQLSLVFSKLQQDPEAVLLGDFNFGDGEQPDSAAIPTKFIDPWLILRPEEPGYTWNRELNPKAKRDSFKGEPSRRLDRILFRSDFWIQQDIQIIGDHSIPKTRPPLFPSDHFGVLATFRKSKSVD